MQALSGKRVLVYFLAFFITISMVDAIMVTLAMRTHSGLVTEHPYEKGLAHNQTIEAAELQQQRGFKSTIVFAKNRIHVTLRGKDGKMLRSDTIQITAFRPVKDGMDITISLTPDTDGYTGELVLPEPGLWELRLKAIIDGMPYQQRKRIVIE